MDDWKLVKVRIRSTGAITTLGLSGYLSSPKLGVNQDAKAGDRYLESVGLVRLDFWSFACLFVWRMVLGGKSKILYAQVVLRPLRPSHLAIACCAVSAAPLIVRDQ